MKTRVLIVIFVVASMGLCNTPASGDNLVLPTGGRVVVELVTSYAVYHNTLSLVSPSAAIVLSGCQVEGVNALPLQLLSEKTSQHGCRVELDADPTTAGVQPFAANDTLEFNLCAQSDGDPATCENYWSSDPDSNTDHQDHVKTTELYPGDPNVGGRVFMLTWEDMNNLGDQDFNDLIAVVRVIQDTDGDGLWDDWESKGIDTNGDGSPDYTIPDNPNVNHKDIYLEIDFMDCTVAGSDCITGDNHNHRPKAAAITEARQAFAAADVTNPDGVNGITLHVDIDDAIAHDNEMNLGCFGGALNFDTIKNDPNFFGPNNPRRFTHHYVIFGHRQTSNSTSSGCGEVHGNDYLVTLGEWNTRCVSEGPNGVSNTTPAGDDLSMNNTIIVSGPNLICNTTSAGDDVQEVANGSSPPNDVDADGLEDRTVGTLRQQSGTLMHELGHNLILEHGGNVKTNYKPNYLSNMNYWFQFGIPPLDRLAFSADDLADLNENSLNEPLGIQDGTDTTNYVCPDFTVRTGAGTGAINWNCGTDIGTDTAAAADINCDGALNTLTGYDDWEHLRYDFQTSAQNFQDGVHDNLDVPDMSFSTYMLVINHPPVAVAGSDQTIDCTCSAGTTVTLDGSGSYDADNDPLTYTWEGVFGALTGAVVQPTLPPGSHTIILTVEDGKGGSASDAVVVTINEDTAPPVISCNAPATITPPTSPLAFTATVADTCDEDPLFEIKEYSCYFYTRKGKRIDKAASCMVEISGDTITILDSGGIADRISWKIPAADKCGNTTELECTVVVTNPAIP